MNLKIDVTFHVKKCDDWSNFWKSATIGKICCNVAVNGHIWKLLPMPLDWSMFSELGLHNFLDRLITFFHHEMLTFVYKKAPFGPDFSWHHLCFLSSVCYQDSAGFQCTCEDQYRWSCDKCLLYGSCDNITDDTCGCLTALPDGEYCQLSHQLSTF